MSEPTLPLLNIYEIDEEGRTRHLVGFLDTVLAGARGINPRAMVGEFQPTPENEFDVDTFSVNPEFVAAFQDYMNEIAGRSPEVREAARQLRSDWLYLTDPRNQTPADRDPPQEDILGCFAVDQDGQIVPNSFQYNTHHQWFSVSAGVSGLLEDRRFYDWLHSSEIADRG